MQYGQQPVFAYSAGPAAPGQYAMQQQQQVYQIQQQRPPVIRGYAARDAKTTVALGAVQLVVGILSIAFQSGALSIEQRTYVSYSFYTVEFVGYGIWCGIMYLVAGILGIVAGKQNGSPSIIGFLVFNILCSLISWVHLGFAAANLGIVRTCQTHGYYNYGYYYGSYGSSRSYCQDGRFYAWVALDSLLVILSILEFIIAVTASSICCRALGCCCSSLAQPTYVVRQPVVVNGLAQQPYPTQPMMTVPIGYVNQGFPSGYPPQHPAQGVTYAAAATNMPPAASSAATSYAPAGGAEAPPPPYRDETKGQP